MSNILSLGIVLHLKEHEEKAAVAGNEQKVVEVEGVLVTLNPLNPPQIVLVFWQWPVNYLNCSVLAPVFLCWAG